MNYVNWRGHFAFLVTAGGTNGNFLVTYIVTIAIFKTTEKELPLKDSIIKAVHLNVFFLLAVCLGF